MLLARRALRALRVRRVRPRVLRLPSKRAAEAAREFLGGRFRSSISITSLARDPFGSTGRFLLHDIHSRRQIGILVL